MARTDRIAMRNQWKSSGPKSRGSWFEYRRARLKKIRERALEARIAADKEAKLRAKRLRDAEIKRQKRLAAKVQPLLQNEPASAP